MKELIVIASLCQALDFSTTAAAMHRGFVEGNPLLAGHPAKTFTIKGSIDVAALWYAHKRKDKPAGKVLPIALAASGCAAGMLNIRTMKAGAK